MANLTPNLRLDLDTLGKVGFEQAFIANMRVLEQRLGLIIPVRTEGIVALRQSVENAMRTIAAAVGIPVAVDTTSMTGMQFSMVTALNQIDAAVGGGTILTVPAAPTIGIAVAGDGQVSIPFTDGSNGGATITVHKVYRSTTDGFTPGPGNLLGTLSTGSPFIDTGLTNGTPYFYRLSAVNSAGEGAKSAQTSATPAALAAPTITTAASLVDNGNGTLTYTAATFAGATSTAHRLDVDGRPQAMPANPISKASYSGKSLSARTVATGSGGAKTASRSAALTMPVAGFALLNSGLAQADDTRADTISGLTELHAANDGSHFLIQSGQIVMPGGGANKAGGALGAPLTVNQLRFSFPGSAVTPSGAPFIGGTADGLNMIGMYVDIGTDRLTLQCAAVQGGAKVAQAEAYVSPPATAPDPSADGVGFVQTGAHSWDVYLHRAASGTFEKCGSFDPSSISALWGSGLTLGAYAGVQGIDTAYFGTNGTVPFRFEPLADTTMVLTGVA